MCCESDRFNDRAATGTRHHARRIDAGRDHRIEQEDPLVRRHPGSGRKALYIARHIAHIVGWPVAEGQALIDELIAFATRPQFVYAHKWRVGDLVIWDNRCTMHRAMPFDDMGLPRDMRRTTVREKLAVAAEIG